MAELIRGEEKKLVGRDELPPFPDRKSEPREKEFVSPTRIDNLYEHQSKEGAYPSFSSFRESIQPRSIVRRVFRETFSTRASSLYLSLYLLPYRPRIVARSAAIIIIPFPFDLDLDGRETVSSAKRVGSARKRTRVANW